MLANSTNDYAPLRHVFVAIDRAVGLPDTLAALKERGLEGVLQGVPQDLEARTNEKQFLSGCAALLRRIFVLRNLQKCGLFAWCASGDAVLLLVCLVNHSPEQTNQVPGYAALGRLRRQLVGLAAFHVQRLSLVDLSSFELQLIPRAPIFAAQ